MMKTVITIDGGVASGTTTLARNLALALEIPRIDSGSMYRALTFLALRNKVDPHDEAACTKLAQTAELDMPDGEVIGVNGEKVVEWVDGQRLDRLHTAKIDPLVPVIAAHKGLRDEVNAAQRKFAASSGAVADGRDCGMIVFPGADLKLFLTVDAQEAARRRSDADGRKVTIQEIEDRNQADRNHKFGALAKASDAVQIDTTNTGTGELVQVAMELLHQPVSQRPKLIFRQEQGSPLERR